MGTFDLAEQKLINLESRVASIEAYLRDQPPPVEPEPEPEPKPPATGSLAGNVVMMWHHCWKGPLPYLGYPVEVRAKINTISLGIAQSGGAGTGKLSYYNRFGAQLAPAIAAAKAVGVTVQMGIGGSSDGGITITNPTQVDQAFVSMVWFVDTYGITGMDIDLEPSGSAWNEASLVALVEKLLAKYPSFIIGITPGLYGTNTARWMSLARALGNRYHYMAPMLYDFPEAGDTRLTAVALDKCRLMSEGGVPNSKMILGFMTRQGNYPNSTPGPQLTWDAYSACKQRYPGLRGAFHWEDAIDAANGWAWIRKHGS